VSSAAGLSLEAQPAAFTDSVRRNGFVSGTGLFYAGNFDCRVLIADGDWRLQILQRLTQGGIFNL